MPVAEGLHGSFAKPASRNKKVGLPARQLMDCYSPMPVSTRSPNPAAYAGPPGLAVLIPVFNGQLGLGRSLDSLRHEAAAIQVFVVDDGSVPPISLPEALPFPVTLIRLPANRGITAALNAGLERIIADGFSYVARLDAGDLSLPGRFAAQIAFLGAHPDHAVVGTHVEMVDEDGCLLYRFAPPTDHTSLLRRLRYENPLSHPSVMIRTSALRACGPYRELYPGGEDYELWLRLARDWNLANLDQVFVRKQETGSSITSRRLRLGISRLRIQIDHFTPGSIHAYLGIVRSLMSLLVSRASVFRIRRLQTRSAGSRNEL
jgi:glycosyltransferase involved in cell wall biosynthesis